MSTDIWGRIYLDHWRGERHPHYFVRDDGNRVEVESAAGYFTAPRGDADRVALEALEGRVLDLGCGVGSYTLFLEERGVEVVAVDSRAGGGAAPEVALPSWGIALRAPETTADEIAERLRTGDPAAVGRIVCFLVYY